MLLRKVRRHCITPILFALVSTSMNIACSAGTQPPYEVYTLTSGRQVKVLSEGRLNFEQSGPALMLRYQTDVSLTDTAALRTEAADIWRDYERKADSAGVHTAVLSANTPPGAGLISRSEGYNFVYEKGADGRWQARR